MDHVLTQVGLQKWPFVWLKPTEQTTSNTLMIQFSKQYVNDVIKCLGKIKRYAHYKITISKGRVHLIYR